MSLFEKAGEKFEETKQAFVDGESTSYICPNCEEELSESHEFCPNCGEELAMPEE